MAPGDPHGVAPRRGDHGRHRARASVLGLSFVFNATCSSLRHEHRLGSPGGGGTGHSEGGSRLEGPLSASRTPTHTPGRAGSGRSPSRLGALSGSLAGGGFRPKVLVLPASLTISAAGAGRGRGPGRRGAWEPHSSRGPERCELEARPSAVR